MSSARLYAFPVSRESPSAAARRSTWWSGFVAGALTAVLCGWGAWLLVGAG